MRKYKPYKPRKPQYDPEKYQRDKERLNENQRRYVQQKPETQRRADRKWYRNNAQRKRIAAYQRWLKERDKDKETYERFRVRTVIF